MCSFFLLLILKNKAPARLSQSMEEMAVSCRGFFRQKSLFLESKTNRRAVAYETFPIEKKCSYPVLVSLITARGLQRPGAISLADPRTANGSPLSECPQDQKRE